MAESGNLRAMAAERYRQRMPGYATAIATRLGSPLGSRRLSERQQAELWSFQAPGTDPQAMLAQGMAPREPLGPLHDLIRRTFAQQLQPVRPDGLNHVARLAERYAAQDAGAGGLEDVLGSVPTTGPVPRVSLFDREGEPADEAMADVVEA